MDLEIAFMGLEKYFLTKQIEIKNFNFMSIKSKKKKKILTLYEKKLLNKE